MALSTQTNPWGTGSWGLKAWGGGSPGVMVSNAFAAGWTLVRVTLAGVALQQSSVGVGDALNPRTWKVTRKDTGQSLTVIGVSKLSSFVFDLALLSPVGDFNVQQTLDASALLAANGTPVLPSALFDFAGVQPTRTNNAEVLSPFTRLPTQDLFNAQVPQPGIIPATLGYGLNGDYLNVSGIELTKKMILRRWTTARNGFFHLPGFGAGLQPKQIIRNADIPSLQQLLQNLALQEPDVVACTVSIVVYPAQGVLYAIGKVTTSSGESDTVNMPLGPSSGVTF